MMRTVYPIVGTCCVFLAFTAQLLAQREQFPTPTQPLQSAAPYSVAPSPYSVPAAPAPTYYTPATTPPTLPGSTYAPANVGPPPSFDPYSIGGAAAPPPPLAQYPVAQSAAVQPYATPAAPPPLQPSNPFQYQPAPYDMATSGEGYWQKTQRLLQEISAEYTFLYGKQSNPNDFGLNRLELSRTFAFPMFYDIQTPLLVTPGFAFNWLDGPSNPGPPPPDLPPRVYDAYLDLAWYPHPYEWLGLELGFRTGVYSDFDHVDSDSIRVMGRGAADIAIAPDMDVVLGAAYLDRLDVKILPVVGIYYRPSPDWD